MKKIRCFAMTCCFLFFLMSISIADDNMPNIISTLDSIPNDASVEEAVTAIETALGASMFEVGAPEGLPVFYLDAPDLLLFDHPIVVATYSNYTWDHTLLFFRDAGEREAFLAGEKKRISTNQSFEFIDETLHNAFALYERFGSSFGELIGGGFAAVVYDGESTAMRYYSLPLTEEGTIDADEIKRIFSLSSDGEKSIYLETDNDWIIHFLVLSLSDSVQPWIACWKSYTCFMESTGYIGFEGPDGSSRNVSAHPLPLQPIPLPVEIPSGVVLPGQ